MTALEERLQENNEYEDWRKFLAWLLVEISPTLICKKPATILNFIDTEQMRMYTLWQRYGEVALEPLGLRWLVVNTCARGVRVLFYHPEGLQRQLAVKEHREFLKRFGYTDEMTLEEKLQHFKERFKACCPHEMGILLGIPLKDVLGFMGIGEECRTCSGMWQVYGDPTFSLKIMDEWKTAMADMRQRLESSATIDDLFLTAAKAATCK